MASVKTLTLESIKEMMEAMFANQEKNILALISANHTIVTDRLNKLEVKMTKQHEELKTITDDVNHLKENVNHTDGIIRKLEEKIITLKKNLTDVEKASKEKQREMEDRSRRNNLRIDGIKENDKESWHECEKKVQDIIAKKLGIKTNIIIERAHRTGKKDERKPRCIVFKLLNYKDKELILNNASRLKNTGIFVNEDFSKETLEKRKKLWVDVKKERANGKFATIIYDKLIVKEFKRKQ